MENFIVSARKYRPSTFISVVGQGALTATLKNAIKNNHLAHAYLFCGPRGVGKTTCARIFAKTINCSNLTANFEACNECESCKAFNEQRSYNIHELDAASNNSVEDIRSLIDQVRIPPQIGHYSVYIIDEVHMLSAAAFNAFLKTLEEPPAHAIFILATTEKHKIIPTILSRCQIYDFNRISINDTVEHLLHVAKSEGIDAEPEALNVIAQKADGGMRDALSIFDQVVSFCGDKITYLAVIENLNVLDYDYYFKLTDAFLEGKVKESLLTFNEILNKGFDAHNFIGGLGAHLRDVLMCKDPDTAQLLEVASSIRDTYVQQARRCDDQFLYKSLSIINECDLNFRISKNKRLLTELMLIRLCQLTDQKKNQLIEDGGLPEIEPIPEMHTQATAQQVSAAATTVQPVAGHHVPATSAQVEQTVTVAPPLAAIASRPISISIKNTVQPRVENEDAALTEKPLQKRHAAFSQEQLTNAWNTFASDIIPDMQHAKNVMLNNAPVLNDDGSITVALYQSMQENSLNEVLQQLIAYLSDSLKNDTITIRICIDETKENTRAFTPQERFMKMIEENPALALLRKELNLDLD
jgi:DNA polymerase-3 subunit gamma/tau